jgi:hypothetical protein
LAEGYQGKGEADNEFYHDRKKSGIRQKMGSILLA